MQGRTTEDDSTSTTPAERDRKIASARWLAVILGSAAVVIVGLVGVLLLLRRGTWERGNGGGREARDRSGTPGTKKGGNMDVWRESARRVKPMSVEDLKSQFADGSSEDGTGDSKEGRS